MSLKDNIEKLLKEKKVPYRFIPLPEDLPMDVPSHVVFHGIKMANAMATILYKTEKGIIGAVKRADTQIDQEKLKKVADVKELVFASKSDLEKLGTEVGMVPYVGLDIPYFIDEKVVGVGKAHGTGGTKVVGMVMEALDIPKANGGVIGDFTEFEKHVDISGKRHRILSGITPSGDGSLHIGNYLGAVKQYIKLADPSASSGQSHECFLMVADLHALTTVQEREQLQRNTETLILNELSLLLGELGEMKNVTFFRQSDVPEHAYLQTILNNVTPLGLIKRAHAYKDKLEKDTSMDEINMGLFNYPVLMASDILIYKADLVPVGKDQKQHIEITRDIAERFNKIYGRDGKTGRREYPTSSGSAGLRGVSRGVFTLPEPYIPEDVAVILGTDGKRKMSKSLGNIVSIFEDEEIIRKQVMGTYTDPTRAHANDPGHTEGNMVFAYLDFFGESGKVDELKKAYREGKIADIEVKNYLFESLIKTFTPARNVYKKLKANPEIVRTILKNGAEKAQSIARETVKEVVEVIGLKNSYSMNANFARPPLARGAPQGVAFKTQITIDDFVKLEMRVGKVVEATNKEGSEKLIRLVVDFGPKDRGDKGNMGNKGEERETRIVFTGVRGFGYTPGDFKGKQFFFITNLAPRKMMDEESQGMIMAVDGDPSTPAGGSGQSKPLFLSADGMPVGAKMR